MSWKLLLMIVVLLGCSMFHYTVASDDNIDVKAYNATGGSSAAVQLLTSGKQSGGCQEYKTVVCEQSGDTQPSPIGTHLKHFGHSNYASTAQCPSSSLTDSCWNGASPPEVNYQLIHKDGSTSWILQLHWTPPPLPNGNCTVSQYHVLVYSGNSKVLSFSATCQSMIAMVNDLQDTVLLAGSLTNDSTHGYFQQVFTRDWNHFHIKVVGYPSFEYPLLYVEVPQQCNQQYFYGCSNCNDGGCEPMETQPNVLIHSPSLSNDSQLININITWLSFALTGVNEYFLHTKTSSGKQLHRLDKATEHVILSGLPADNETFIWLEQFTCGCSNATPIHQIIIYDNDTVIVHQVDYSFIEEENEEFSTSTSSSISTSSDIPLPSTSYQTSITTNIDTLSSTVESSIRYTHSTVSSYTTHFNIPSSSPTYNTLSSPSHTPHSPAPSSDNNNRTYIILSIALPILLLIIAGIIIATISLFFIMKYRSSNNKFTSDLPQPTLPKPGINSSTSSQDDISLRSITTYPPVNVIAIIPHDTCVNDKEAYLAFFDDLVLQGAQLQVYCRSERTTPADWLQSVFTNDSLVLVIINEHFYYEWNRKVISDVPVVFALKQLVHSLMQQSKDLRNFALVLPRPNTDKEYIPESYLFHTVQQFALEDTEAMSRFVFKVPEFTVDSSC